MASSARLDELKKKFDENPRRYFAPLANEYRKQGDLAQAIALCRTYLPNQPGHISGNIVLGQSLYESQELDEARQIFASALELDPENLIALRYLGDIAREEGSPSLAQSWYQRVLEADPRNDEIAQLLRDVEGAAASERVELASRPTPPTSAAIEPAVVEPSIPAVPGVPQLSFEPAHLPGDEPEPEPPAQPESEAPATTSATAPAYEPVFEEFAVAETEAPAETTLGADEGSAAPVIDDWFSDVPAPAAAQPPVPGSFLPDLHEAESLPPSVTSEEAAQADALTIGAWDAPDESNAMPAPPALDEVSVRQESHLEFTIDPESPTAEFSIDAAEAFEQELEAAASAEAARADFDKDPFGVTAAPAGDADWETPAEPEPSAGWPEPVAESPAVSSWESALAPEQLSAAEFSEEPDESASYLNSDPHIGRTPAFSNTVPEEPPAAFVTETMAELYLQQGFNEEALAIYRQLLAQSPGDETLRRRVHALEQGSDSPVMNPTAGRAEPSTAQSVRAFFARFATRTRRQAADGGAMPNAGDGGDGSTAHGFGGAAMREEALTEPDESSLMQVFASRSVSTDDAQAAATLASAFGVAPPTGNGGELSLEQLFRDVQARSPGAVTPAGNATDPSPAPTTPRQAADVESHADIEQFTAWLEGLKKK